MHLANKILKSLMKIAGLSAVILGGALGGPAAAFPTHEINWEYYSDATYNEQVGGWTISCSGNGARWGVKTDFAIFVQGPSCD